MRYIFYLFWILVVLLGVTFASLNAHIVTVNYYVRESTIRLPLLLIIVLVIGALLGVVALLPSLIMAKSGSRRLKHRIKQVEQEVNNLRSIPIKEEH